MKYLNILLVVKALFACMEIAAESHANHYHWKSLFNGKDLDGWDTYISFQPNSGDETITGVNEDPKNIFTVIDGMIRISGEEWGALTSIEEFENYHLKLDFKWGVKKWPPRQNSKRDSGLLYHCVGPHGAQGNHWMRSHELQIQEGDTGDYFSLAGASFDIAAAKIEISENTYLKFDPSQKIIPLDTETYGRRIIKSADFEKPYGEWNTIEIICDGDTVKHIVNGHVVFEATESRQLLANGDYKPLTRGKIQIQSESAEIFIRNIFIRSLEN